MTIHVHYYAVLAERRGLEKESLSVSARSLVALYEDLSNRHAFGLAQSAVRPAVNDVFRSWDFPLSDGDTVVFVPPVSGG